MEERRKKRDSGDYKGPERREPVIKENRAKKVYSIITTIVVVIVALSIMYMTVEVEQKNKELDQSYSLMYTRITQGIDNIGADVDNNINLLYSINEKVARSQMRYNLRAMGDMIMEDVKKHPKNNIIRDTQYRNDVISKYTKHFRYYDNEGDPFILNSNQIFERDDSSDCGAPMYDGKLILDIPNRSRDMLDEVIWQSEAKWYLDKVGIISNKEFDKYNRNGSLVVNKLYDKLDVHLSNLSVFRYQDVEYIKATYPVVYNGLKNLRIIMHYDEKQAEKVLDFMRFQNSTGIGDNLGWNFNPPPYKEILETYVIPPTELGFYDEAKTVSAGIPNKNYFKITIVQGLQIYKLNKEYDPFIEAYKKQQGEYRSFAKEALNQYKNTIDRQKTYNKQIMYVMVIVFIISLLMSVYSYTKVPAYMANQCINNPGHTCYLAESIDTNKKGGGSNGKLGGGDSVPS